MLDFNGEEQQKQRAYGPVPAGSRVLLRMELVKPQHADPEHEYVQRARSGLRGLWVEFTVVAGTFESVRWRENVWLPTGHQTVRLTEGQTKGCNMWGARLKAALEASRGVSPKDTSPKASRARQTQDWLDFHGLEFPAVLGIANEAYIGRDGREYWNNTMSRVVTFDDKDYQGIMDGGEIITDGPVVGKQSEGGQQGGNHSGAHQGDWPPPDSENPGYGCDRVPF